MNIEKRTAILYEAFELLKNIAMYCFQEPHSPNEANAWKLIHEWDSLQNQEQLQERNKQTLK